MRNVLSTIHAVLGLRHLSSAQTNIKEYEKEYLQVAASKPGVQGVVKDSLKKRVTKVIPNA